MGRICGDLPEELLEEIFSWVPPRSLFRFKCVSKSWYALINSLAKNPEFVSKHLSNIIDKKNILSSATCLLFCSSVRTFWPPQKRELVRHKMFTSLTISHDDNERDHLNYVSEVFHIDVPLNALHISIAKRSHCNGLICLLTAFHEVILCNPAIKEYRTLPESSLTYDGFMSLGLGFNYDSKAKDYKVVKFGYDVRQRSRVESVKTRAEVYSMRNDTWREIGIHFNYDRSPFCHGEVFSKGVFYWCVETPEYVIISFSMFEEVFHSIPLPNHFPVKRRGGRFIKLVVWNESVALFSCHCEREFTHTFEVWVMGDYASGVKGSCSWIKKLVIGPLVDIRYPLIFLKHDELLMKATDGNLMLYNLCSQMLRKITLTQVAFKDPCLDFSYIKSLVSVQGGSQYHL
ncbi:F-box domain containing protein [Trema orientale]|uniref:F-box domain containing protein n=1 Tax=Trema orientale TaxID=63057 RepID=A0A2P5FSP0_TREOI|nr:F-box domain containing protein [Trema orientale]